MFLNIDKQPGSNLAAIDDSGSGITYGELCRFADKFGAVVPARSFIFILAENTIGSLCGYVGALSNKVVPLILSNHGDRQLYENLFSIYQPEYIWLPEGGAEKLGLKTVFSGYGFELAKTSFGKKKLYGELSLLLPTSGSTGSSKLVRHSYRNIEANAHNVALLFGLTRNERPLVTLPMHYTMGLSVIASHLSAGATLLMVKRSLVDPLFWKFLREEEATSFTGVPFSFEVLRKLRFFRMELPHLKIITQGGGKMNNALFEECAEYAAKSGKQFIATYGQTEGTARMAYLPAGLAMHKTGSIGKAIPNGVLSVIDDNGNEIEKTEAEGEMIYRGENVTLGYALHPDDLIKGDENNGVLHTGDIVRRDTDGCYYIIGRKSRFLKLFGFRVGLDECEHLIRSEYQIDCACTGTDDGMTIFITDSLYCKELPGFLSRKTGIIATAFSVKVIEQFPKNEAGKILYTKLSN